MKHGSFIEKNGRVLIVDRAHPQFDQKVSKSKVKPDDLAFRTNISESSPQKHQRLDINQRDNHLPHFGGQQKAESSHREGRRKGPRSDKKSTKGSVFSNIFKKDK